MVMAPLTRFRSTMEHIPGKYMKEYYEQRASVPGTLLITEATFIAPQAGGYNNVPGIWSDEQVEAWKPIVDAVHAKGSFIYLQLWALGRAAGAEAAAKNLQREGANGYLIDQFWQDVSNRRNDGYGGSVEKRARFGLEVTKAVIEACGGDSKKVGMRLSPWSTFQSMGMQEPIPQFSYIVEELKKLRLAYLHLVESRTSGKSAVDAEYATVTGNNDKLAEVWGVTAPIILAGGFDAEKAKKAVSEVYTSENVCIAFGRSFISTPDLPFRIQHEIELAPYDRKTFYKAESPDGYIDYPFSKEFLGEASKL
ncbi:hypothetical protein LTR57_005043 [Friedmanniomyces endolithicus]|nr:hypothetical protein LTR57_005043 [Friedmanniomyces endolithicus]KAK0998923.1 hypothetical protein LTR54_009363 [Friedmanniomyces endolithicus]